MCGETRTPPCSRPLETQPSVLPWPTCDHAMCMVFTLLDQAGLFLPPSNCTFVSTPFISIHVHDTMVMWSCTDRIHLIQCWCHPNRPWRRNLDGSEMPRPYSPSPRGSTIVDVRSLGAPRSSHPFGGSLPCDCHVSVEGTFACRHASEKLQPWSSMCCTTST